jgi:hypothetical protein
MKGHGYLCAMKQLHQTGVSRNRVIGTCNTSTIADAFTRTGRKIQQQAAGGKDGSGTERGVMREA